MAKYEVKLKGDFTKVLSVIENGIIQGNISASLEDGSDYELNGIRCAIRVFERYSILGKNRVSMSLTLLGCEDTLYVTAITSGGSTGVFLKLNTLGEESFLERIKDILSRYVI